MYDPGLDPGEIEDGTEKWNGYKGHYIKNIIGTTGEIWIWNML